MSVNDISGILQQIAAMGGESLTEIDTPAERKIALQLKNIFPEQRKLINYYATGKTLGSNSNEIKQNSERIVKIPALDGDKEFWGDFTHCLAKYNEQGELIEVSYCNNETVIGQAIMEYDSNKNGTITIKKGNETSISQVRNGEITHNLQEVTEADITTCYDFDPKNNKLYIYEKDAESGKLLALLNNKVEPDSDITKRKYIGYFDNDEFVMDPKRYIPNNYYEQKIGNKFNVKVVYDPNRFEKLSQKK